MEFVCVTWYTIGMRYLLLVLISLCMCAAEPEIHMPAGKDLPAWAKDLNKKFEPAAGEDAPWKKLTYAHHETKEGNDLRSKAETAYFEAYETALENFAKTANLTNLPKGTENDIGDYVTGLAQFKFRNRKDWRHDIGHWQPNDDFYIAYAKLNHDPLAFAFLWLPANRAKYCH